MEGVVSITCYHDPSRAKTSAQATLDFKSEWVKHMPLFEKEAPLLSYQQLKLLQQLTEIKKAEGVRVKNPPLQGESLWDVTDDKEAVEFMDKLDFNQSILLQVAAKKVGYVPLEYLCAARGAVSLKGRKAAEILSELGAKREPITSTRDQVIIMNQYPSTWDCVTPSSEVDK